MNQALAECVSKFIERVPELRSVSFIENLVKHGKVLVSLKRLFGPDIEGEIRNRENHLD